MGPHSTGEERDNTGKPKEGGGVWSNEKGITFKKIEGRANGSFGGRSVRASAIPEEKKE